MQYSNENYKKLAGEFSPKSPKVKDFVFAFVVGGIVCVFGQLLLELFLCLDIKEEISEILVPCTLIFIAVLFTGLKIFPSIAKFSGAGVLVPITGFANAVASPAIEFKNEGFVLGVGSKIFTVAGPVILYGTTASVIYGVIYYIVRAVF